MHDGVITTSVLEVSMRLPQISTGLAASFLAGLLMCTAWAAEAPAETVIEDLSTAQLEQRL